jgi:hypothetical protein
MAPARRCGGGVCFFVVGVRARARARRPQAAGGVGTERQRANTPPPARHNTTSNNNNNNNQQQKNPISG